ncbi:MAG: bifunctional folylpolyglutamate synthase/dihydrofolate synthase [Alphaproteobacteria bacterium]|nr:bifunctional folylpolyglutamate synthase/dihydrofolate synthase [Alphaproteobacteria bacterium]
MHTADLRHPNATLQQKLQALYRLRTGSKVNWDSTAYQSLLRSMGEPHRRLPPVFHVAGTNGKGSIVAFLRAILEAQGYRVHAYTSPHLQRVNERIRLAGEEISDSYLEELIDEISAQHSLENLSFFEITTALAFRAFSTVPGDVLLLEVGMGGRLDCTNVIDDPLVTVISRISRDHTEFLGETLPEIAAEKAGIIKKGRPCVVSAQGKSEEEAQIFPVLEKIASTRGAELHFYGRDWMCYGEEGRMILSHDGKKTLYPLPGLTGDHQIINAGAAIMALRCAAERLPVEERSIETGLKAVRWSGRLQLLDSAALGLTERVEVWLDSGHNDSAGDVLARQIQKWAEDDPMPVHLILGMLGHKDVHGFLSPMAPFLTGLSLVGIDDEKNVLSLPVLLEKAGSLVRTLDVQSFETVREALGALRSRIDGPCRILIAGSVYLAGSVLDLTTGSKDFSSGV